MNINEFLIVIHVLKKIENKIKLDTEKDIEIIMVKK